jgi:hypothetical protein
MAPISSTAPAGTVNGCHQGAGLPSRPAPNSTAGDVAPARQTTASWENFSEGPVAVHSRAGAPSSLPTARFASRSDTSSIGPLGGTPTCQ